MRIKEPEGPVVEIIFTPLGEGSGKDIIVPLPEGRSLIVAAGGVMTLKQDNPPYDPSSLSLGQVITLRVKIRWPSGMVTYVVPLSQESQKEVEVVIDLLRKQEPGAREALRALRERRGWSREQFASMVDVSPQTVYRWEGKGSFPRERS